MGSVVSAHVNACLVEYLKTVGSGKELYVMKKYEEQIKMGEAPDAPKCKIRVRDFSVVSPDDFVFDDLANLIDLSINMRTSKIVIEIGEAILECEKLGIRNVRVSGKILVFDVQLKAIITPAFEETLRIKECDPTVEVKKIKSELQFTVDGSNYSEMVNALLSTAVPVLVNTVLNFILKMQKNKIRDHLNTITLM